MLNITGTELGLLDETEFSRIGALHEHVKNQWVMSENNRVYEFMNIRSAEDQWLDEVTIFCW